MGKKPDLGINPQKNNTLHDAKFDSLEIPVCVRSSRPRTDASHTTRNIPVQQRTQNPKNTATSSFNTAQRSRTGSAPYLYGNTEERRRAELARTRTASIPKTAGRKPQRKKLHPILELILKNKKAAVICSVVLLCICITVPLAVYGASVNEDSGEPDFEMISTAPPKDKVIDAEDMLLGTAGTLPEIQTPTESSDPAEDTDALDTDNTDTAESTDDPSESEESESSDEQTTEPETEPETEPAPAVPVGFKVTVQFYDRELLTCTTGPTTLRQILEASGIWLTENEKPSVGLDDPIEYESWITVSKTEYKQVTESEAIPYSSETVNSTSVPRGTYRTAIAGQNGVRDTVYTVEYVNGVEVKRTKEYDYIAAYPVNEVVHYGVGGTFTAPDGNVYSYSYCTNVRATYYNIHGTTATGMPTGTNVVATDPSVFPLGTKMYVLNSTFDMGVRIAADTGGAVRGNLIDIWMDASCPYYEQFAAQGVWDMTVYVLD